MICGSATAVRRVNEYERRGVGWMDVDERVCVVWMDVAI